MHIERGSTWNKWDFHVHTPYSILNNQFGFDPDPEWKSDVTEFDNYVKTLFTKAVDKGIVAIGITDYFSIDGYKRIFEEYLKNPEKMAALFPEEGLRSEIERIYVFPNIEFRLPFFIGKDSRPVNYHVLFSNSVSISDIENSFLSQLHLNYTLGGEFPLNRQSIERIGKEHKKHNAVTGSDYHVGLEQITVKDDEIRGKLNDVLFAENTLISVAVDESFSEKTVPWAGRDATIRKILYQQSDLLMTSNEKTRLWALGKDGIDAQIEEFGSLKPCIWGSDAHCYNRMFCPDGDRFCWIKAEPTFEGLQQILYEPDDRVRIQKEKPEEKSEHQLIDYIFFDDEQFENTPIYFSEGLTAIIGGKSTGKSILLRHIAKSVDYKQVKDKESRSVATSNKLEVDARVFWKDGVSGERKIIYIPQSWLNRVVDESGGDTQLNSMVRDILLQQECIHSAHNTLTGEVAVITSIVKQNIDNYVACIDRVKACEKQLNEHGRSDAFISSIEKLEKERDKLSAEAGITDEVIEKYGNLERQISEQKELLSLVLKEEPQIDFINEPYLYIPGLTKIEHDGSYSYDLSRTPIAGETINRAIEQINTLINDAWAPAILEASAELEKKKTTINEALAELDTVYEPLKQIVAKNDQLKKIDNQLQEEKRRLHTALELEKERDTHLSEAEELKKQIIGSRNLFHTAYEKYSQIIAENNSNDTDLVFEAKIEDRRKELFDALYGLFDNRNLKAFRESEYSVIDVESLKIEEGLFEALWNGMSKGTLAFRGGNNAQSVLEKLFSDWFYIHYVVTSGDDTINMMSPGKKALVLLELIVNLEQGNCPILIDQPEDDLDNRSIYTELVNYLKEKKHERQIIVVTHNANVVVGADAEEVIIANQAGKEAENHSKKFEYRCGAIENVSPVIEDGCIRKGVLNQKGVQEQICDILEGGKEAFEKRANKYFSTS